MFILHSANICVFSCGNYLFMLLWDMSGDSHRLHTYPLMIWKSLYSGACECFSEGVASSPGLWLVTGDKLVWLQVSFEWEGRGLFPWDMLLFSVVPDTMSEVQEATEFILIGKLISRNVLIDGCFIITDTHAYTSYLKRVHHRTYTLSLYWSRVSCFSHSVHSS